MESGPVEVAIDPNPYVVLSTLALKTLIASAVGVIVAFVLYRYVPFDDPIDVVGPALMRGYSEAAEQWAFYGFWIATSAAGIAIGALCVEWRSPTAQLAGATAFLLLAHIPRLVEAPATMSVFLVIWTAACVCGGRGSSIIERRFGRLHWPWMALLAWCVGFHEVLAAIVLAPSHSLVFGSSLPWRCYWASSIFRNTTSASASRV